MELEIKGKQSDDYFLILCVRCDTETRSEYLGWDPGVPHFRATCPKCKNTVTLKLTVPLWRGLPLKPDLNL